jgi:RimJ/RimL family protein N-acetyltransferase
VSVTEHRLELTVMARNTRAIRLYEWNRGFMAFQLVRRTRRGIPF